MKSREYKGLTALVTGASSGIGLAFSRALAERGANIVLSARSEEKLNDFAQELLKERDIWVKVIPCDLSETKAAKQLFDKAKSIKVDILVNCAGFGRWTFFADQPLSTYRDMLNLNIDAVVELSYLFLPLMSDKKLSGVINVASTAAFQPVPYQAVYAASKSFVLNFSEALAGEYYDKGLRVMALCPGYTDTNFMDIANGNPTGMAKSTPEEVVTAALKAFAKNKPYVVPGASNYINSLFPRILSRKAVINIVRNIFKKRVLVS